MSASDRPAQSAPSTVGEIAFVTPTFTPDLERCELLIESLDRFASAYTHYLIIDSHEIPNFRHLQSSRTIIVASEEVIDRRYHRLPGKSGYWFSYRTLPVRGWVTQQLRKLACPTVIPEDIIVCLDSDTAFVRPFMPEHILEQGKLTLLDVDYFAGMVPRWTEVAAALLGIDVEKCPLRGHVGHLIVWSRTHLLALHRAIETATGLPWQIAIGRKTTFSEYILYGVYVRAVLGYEDSQHTPGTRPLVRQPWAHDLTTPAGLEDYICRPDPTNIAVMVHSKFGISANDMRPYFDSIWKESV